MGYIYVGMSVIFSGVIVGMLNCLFHVRPPAWYKFVDMQRFSELQLVLTLIGLAFIFYGIRSKKIRKY